jgi:molybdopterin/thiamine biosynthesis adenylyltransferase
MVTDERYDRQTRIKGWNQKKLEDSSAYVIGSGRLSDFMLVDLISIGIGRIYRVGQSEYFPFEKLNPEIYFEQTPEELITLQEADRIIQPDNSQTFVVDCTNDPISKYFSSTISGSKKLKYFSACSSPGSFSFSSIRSGVPLAEYHQEINQKNRQQGLINSMICGAILSDEIRKYLMPLETDMVLEEYEKSLEEPKSLEKKFIQVGAGATGTFAGIALAALGAEILLVDYDTIERSNLNRQFLFYDSIGLNKAEALAQKIRKFGSEKISSLEKKIDERFRIKNFDFSLSCVDNNDARGYMNFASKQSKTPLINCGSSTEGCAASVYVPGKTSCMSCQLGLEPATKKQEKRAAGDCFNPSLIIPNQIAGALVAKVAGDAVNGKYLSYEYQSGIGLESREISEKCFGGCK